MKHILALCLVLAMVLPSTAFAASNQPANNPAKVSITIVNHGSKTVTAYYKLTGATELGHTWSFGDGFTCHCIHRTHTYKYHGTYTICITLKTTNGQTLKACKSVTV